MGIALMECYICMLRRGNVIYDTEELNTRYVICIVALCYIDTSKNKQLSNINRNTHSPILTFATCFCAKQNILYIYIYFSRA